MFTSYVIVSPGAAFPSASASGNESVFVAVIFGTTGEAGGVEDTPVLDRATIGEPDASGARGPRVMSEMIEQATKVFTDE
jgi:hypothetical protein